MFSHDKASSVSTTKLINYKDCFMANLTLKELFAVQQNPSSDSQSTLKSPFLLEKIKPNLFFKTYDLSVSLSLCHKNIQTNIKYNLCIFLTHCVVT